MDTSLTNLSSLAFLTPLPTETLAGQSLMAGSSSTDLDQIGVDFEGLFYSLLLKEMRNSVGTEDGTGLFSGDNTDSLGGMFDMFLGQHLASSGQLGIARMLAAYLSNRPPITP